MHRLAIAAALALTLLASAIAHGDDDPALAPEIALKNALRPAPGMLCGGQPTDEQLAEAKQKGFYAVVNLRTKEEGAEENGEKVAAAGLKWLWIPIAGADDLTVENAKKLDELLKEAGDRPVMVHCKSGNRVGALLAIKAFHVDGKSAEEALAFGKKAGLTKMEPAVAEILKKAEAERGGDR